MIQVASWGGVGNAYPGMMVAACPRIERSEAAAFLTASFVRVALSADRHYYLTVASHPVPGLGTILESTGGPVPSKRDDRPDE